MHRPNALAAILAVAVAPAMVALSPRGAAGAAITYSTMGQVFPWTYGDGAQPGISGTNVIGFKGVTDNQFLAPGAFNLGHFTVAAPPAGTSTTYTNAAFNIELTIPSGSSAPATAISIQGVLNGTVSGPDQSDVLASIKSIQLDPPVLTPGTPAPVMPTPPFPLSALVVPQPIAVGPPGGGGTPLLAQITAVPEPSTLAVSAMALAGLAWIRRPREGDRRPRP